MRIFSFRFSLLVIFFFYYADSSAFQGKRIVQPLHKDTAFSQPYSIKYERVASENSGDLILKKVRCDRNGVVQVFSSHGILTRSGGQFLFPGELVQDLSYKAMADKKIQDIAIYEDQFVYADDKAVLSNAWAGKLYSRHTMSAVTVFCGGEDFSFLLSDGSSIQYVRNSKIESELKSSDKINDILFDKKRNFFWLLGDHTISVFNGIKKTIQQKFTGDGLTCFALINNNKELIVGTHNGYFKLNAETGKQVGSTNSRLPCPDLTVVKEIDHSVWFGSVNGAFMLQPDGKFKYYSSRRWIPANHVQDISAGIDHSILILTDKGLGEIHFTPMTLADKATYFEQQVRARHIRLGFNATIAGMKNGDVTTGSLEDSDNDGLWTSMYLGAEVFRYAATKSPDALQNCRESLDAMERLYTVNGQTGFPSRSFERRGYEISDVHKKNNIDCIISNFYIIFWLCFLAITTLL